MDATRLDPWEFVPAHREQLAALSLCQGVSFELFELFFLKCEYLALPEGQLLLSPGAENHHLYVLLSGEITIFIDAPGSANRLVVPPGEFVGEVSIIDAKPPTGWVAATADSVLLAIPEAVLWEEYFAIPGAARNLLRQMARRLRTRYVEMQASVEKALRLEHLEKELNIARDLQASMLPPPPLFPGHARVEVHASMTPAKHIGGDFYDAFPLDEHTLCVAVGDVAGKGVPAALFMVRCLTLLRSQMMLTRDLLQAIHAVNATLCEDNPMCMFVTLAACVVDTRHPRLEFVSGGHNPPLIGNAAGGFAFLQPPKGMLLGINPAAAFEKLDRILHPGDTLVLYTDGVTEAMNPVNEEYGDERLLRCLGGLGGGAGAGAVLGEVARSVEAFVEGAEPSDDLTLVVMKFSG